MSLDDNKILTKKTSKHPKDTNKSELYEELFVSNSQKDNTKKDIFAMPNIFLNEALLQHTPSKTTQKTSNVQLQKQRNPIASKQVVKRMINQKRKKLHRARIAPMNLSLIEETESEHNITSSSQSNSVLDQSSIDYVLSQQFSEQSYEDDDQINEAFLEMQQQDDSQDVLNKTVVMSKKKAPREYQTPKTPQKLSQKQMIQLQILAKKYSLDTLQAFYLQGQFKQLEYLHILKIKKQQQIRLKQEKFYQNLQKAQKQAHIIDQNYHLIQKKLQKDIEKDRLKLKTYTHQIIQINKKKQKKQKLPNPQQTQLQLKTLEILAELNAKESFLSMLKSGRQEFQLEYNQNIQKIQDKKRTIQNVSENLIFLEIKQLIKRNLQNYQYLISSLVKGRKNKSSLIACNARKHYLKLLSQKYSRQLSKIQEFKEDHLTNEATKLLRSSDNFQITQQLSLKLQNSAKKKVLEKLNQTKQNLLNHLSWLKMIRKDGQLKEGKIFKESVWILTNNLPLNVSISEQKQKYLIENFKFYRRKVVKKLQYHFLTIKEVHDSFLTKKAIQCQKIQTKKKQKVQVKINILEKKIIYLETHYQNKNINQILFSSSSGLKDFTNTNSYLGLLKKGIKNMKELEDKAKILIQCQNIRNISKKKSLIPSKKVVKVDLRTSKQEIQQKTLDSQNPKNSRQFSLKDKIDSRYKIIQKPDDIRVQLERNGQSFKDLCKNLNKINLKNKKTVDLTKCYGQEDKKYTQSEKKNHMDKVYELILNNQISKAQPEENKSQNNIPYCALTPWEIKQGYLSKVKFSHERPIKGSQQLQFEQFIKSSTKPDKSQIINPSYESRLSLNQNYSAQEIDEACKQFSKEFYINPNLSSQLNLSQQQFYFLMSPQYRKHFLQKKVQDQQLQQRILNMIRNNPYPINQSRYQFTQQNPINHMIQTDPYFQQRIQQYQEKIVKHQQLYDPYEPKLVYQTESSDYSRRESISSLFDPFESRLNEIQAKRSFNYLSSNKSDFDTVASDHEEFQEWLSRRY